MWSWSQLVTKYHKKRKSTKNCIAIGIFIPFFILSISFSRSTSLLLFLSSSCGLEAHIVLLGDQCHWGVSVAWGGVCGFSARVLGRWFVSFGIHMNVSIQGYRLLLCSEIVDAVHFSWEWFRSCGWGVYSGFLVMWMDIYSFFSRYFK